MNSIYLSNLTTCEQLLSSAAHTSCISPSLILLFFRFTGYTIPPPWYDPPPRFRRATPVKSGIRIAGAAMPLVPGWRIAWPTNNRLNGVHHYTSKTPAAHCTNPKLTRYPADKPASLGEEALLPFLHQLAIIATAKPRAVEHQRPLPGSPKYNARCVVGRQLMKCLSQYFT
jgi:hypothetical protein